MEKSFKEKLEWTISDHKATLESSLEELDGNSEATCVFMKILYSEIQTLTDVLDYYNAVE